LVSSSYPEWRRDWPEEATATGPVFQGVLVLTPARCDALEDKIRIGSVKSSFLSFERGLFLFPKRGGEEDGYRRRHAGERYGDVLLDNPTQILFLSERSGSGAVVSGRRERSRR
jgi:hypothetical protein